MPFRPHAHIGVPARAGSIAHVIGAKETLEQGTLREVTLDSAELALTVLRGCLRNPEKKSTIHLGPSAVIGLRLWQRYTGTGRFQFVAHFDPETLRYIGKDLKGGDSGKFVGVWPVPADFGDFRLGGTSDRPNPVAWYDLIRLDVCSRYFRRRTGWG